MSPAQILLINPNISRQTTALMARQAQACVPAGMAGVTLLTATARQGAAMITDEAGLAIAEQQVLDLGLEFAQQQSESQQASVPRPGAIIIAAFGNPGLQRLRQQLPSHIYAIGIGEAVLLAAVGDGTRRFGIATTTPGLEASIAQSVAALGLEAQFTGTRLANGEPLALAADPELQRERLAVAVSQCIEADGAQAVVIGGGPLAEVALWLAPRFAVPVLSPIVSAMRAACKALKGHELIARSNGLHQNT